jgi:hypothetical protein
MREFIRGRRLQALVIASLGVLAVAGVAYAAGGSGKITVCVGHKGGALYHAKHCKHHDGTLSWNIQGPTGATGATGAQGATGTTGVQGPIGPSTAYASYKNGPVPLPATLGTIASLSIPSAGDYVIFAKVSLHDDVNSAVSITCELIAGADSDTSYTDLTGNTGGYVTYETPELNVVHDFTAAGTVNLQCDGYGVSTDASWIKITAIQVGALTNTASP